ncbi:MAG TPA: choice-of-anchor D domain-containing protein, partial [Terriglobales bacterium]|nr:choice-of-anchor D domain-containing protein [Terriglobales bacterium]
HRALGGDVTLHRNRIALLCAAALLVAAPAHALRVATWNITNYQNGQVNSWITPRQPYFRTAIAALNPDILIAQEIGAAGSADADSFQVGVLDVLWPGQWQHTSSNIQQTQSVMFWRTSLVSVTNVTSFSDGGPRDVLQCWVHPVGYSDKSATFRLYSIHLKAGTTPSDATTRNTECTNIRSTINSTPLTNYGPNFLIGGDTNFQGGIEGGYARLTESQSNNNGQCRDTLWALNASQPTWHDNWYWRWYHSQSPCTSNPWPGLGSTFFSGGGLDDRFDIFFTSNSMQDKSGLDLHGYVTFGQDGRHMNDDINASGNDSVGYTVATALRLASDHIPVVAVVRLPAIMSTASQLDFGTVITGATAQRNLSIANVAAWPADTLRYSFVAPTGFSAPAVTDTFQRAVGAGDTSITIGMSTAGIGSLADTLKINTNNPDTTLKRVLLSGRVIRHAAASLESLTVVLGDTLDFGYHARTGFADMTAKVFDQGYDAWQARLSLTNGVIGGGGGRFSIVGGFSGSLVAGAPASFAIHFNANHATADSTYTATLTFSSADESLPGALPQPDLVVTLQARVQVSVDVPEISTASQLDFGSVILGAAAEQALSIANVAILPADSLHYGFAAPAGFTAPSGSFALAAGDPAANHTIGMGTASAGAKSGALTINSDDPDSSAKAVLLSGLVLRHAAPSLDSLTAVGEAALAFGDVPLFHDTTLTVAVHNLGWDAEQARLAITSAEIRGLDPRYTLVDFLPALVSGVGARFHVKFSASCSDNVVAVDTLVFHSADESLPGGTSLPDVRYLTSVNVTGVGPRPTALRFYPPQPNPSAGAFRFAYDLPNPAHVRLEIFDLAGRRVATLVSGDRDAGRHELSWSPRASLRAAGLCFARFTTPGLTRTTRLVLLP